MDASLNFVLSQRSVIHLKSSKVWRLISSAPRRDQTPPDTLTELLRPRKISHHSSDSSFWTPQFPCWSGNDPGEQTQTIPQTDRRGKQTGEKITTRGNEKHPYPTTDYYYFIFIIIISVDKTAECSRKMQAESSSAAGGWTECAALRSALRSSCNWSFQEGNWDHKRKASPCVSCKAWTAGRL